jgi:hypothetical protein
VFMVKKKTPERKGGVNPRSAFAFWVRLTFTIPSDCAQYSIDSTLQLINNFEYRNKRYTRYPEKIYFYLLFKNKGGVKVNYASLLDCFFVLYHFYYQTTGAFFLLHIWVSNVSPTECIYLFNYRFNHVD